MVEEGRMRVGIVGNSEGECEGEGDAEGRLGCRTDKERQGTLPDDRELARSSPAFMVIN
jgi:hypothetical protein